MMIFSEPTLIISCAIQSMLKKSKLILHSSLTLDCPIVSNASSLFSQLACQAKPNALAQLIYRIFTAQNRHILCTSCSN